MFKQPIKLFLIIPFLIFLYTCEEPIEKDTTPPTVSISSHSSGQTIGEIVVIKVSTNDNDGISKVEFYINDELVLTLSESPFEFIWNTTEVEDGEYIIKVISYDTSGNSTESQPIMLKVNNQSYLPSQVNISTIVYENSGFTITWNKSTDTDFESYQLEKSVESLMNDYTVIHSTTDIDKTSYFDSEGDPLNYQYYRITVTDTLGLEKKGQIFSSSLDPIPNSVNVTNVFYSLTNMTVDWEKSTDSDFKHYKLLYSDTENGSKSTIDTYTDINTTTYTTTDFDPTHKNWFWVEVEDVLGQSSIGNGETNTVDLPPTQSEISPIVYENNSFVINWSQSSDDDFVSFELFESNSENMSNKSSIFFSNNPSDIYYERKGISEDERKYYQLETTDYWGLKSRSLISQGSSYDRLVYVDGNKIYSIDSDGFNKKLITETIISYNASLIFDISPTDDRIAYAIDSDNSPNEGDGNIYSVYINGNNHTVLTDNTFEVQNIRFSPYGSYIVFDDVAGVVVANMYDPYLPYEIYRINIDGSNLSELSDSAEIHRGRLNPLITPNSDKIVYLGEYYNNSGDQGTKVGIMNINGSNPSFIGLGDDRYPTITSDGNTIIFANNGNLYSMDINGNNKIQLTNFSDVWILQPFITADNSTIIFSADRIIYSMNIDGSNLQNIGAGVVCDVSKDGRKVLYTVYNYNNDGWEIKSMNTNNNETKLITDIVYYGLPNRVAKFISR